MGAKLFVIDGSPAVRRMVEQVSATEGYEVHAFQDGPSALQAAKSLLPGTVIADFHLEKITFSSFCKEIVRLDQMSDTAIVSLVDSSDKVDEKAYRSLGVAVFLTKPLEPGNLIETLRDLSAKRATQRGGAKSKRSWPPATMSTDLEDETGQESGASDDPVEELDQRQAAMAHAKPSATQPARVDPPDAPPAAQVPPAHLETASKTLIDAMAAGVIPHVTQSILASLPRLIRPEVEQQLAARLDTMIETHVAKALSSALLTDTVESVVRRLVPELASKHLETQMETLGSSLLPRLETQLKPVIHRAIDQAVSSGTVDIVEKSLPNVVREQIGSIDRLVMNTVQDLATPQVRDAVENVTRQLVDDRAPRLLREKIESLDRLIVNTVQDLASAQLHDTVERAVREAAHERVSAAIQEIVPLVAETHVTAEIKRLSDLD